MAWHRVKGFFMSELPSLIDAIEFRMEQYGHKQATAARVMGIAVSHFNEVLKGKRTPSVKQLKKLYKYGIPATVLLNESIPPTK